MNPVRKVQDVSQHFYITRLDCCLPNLQFFFKSPGGVCHTHILLSKRHTPVLPLPGSLFNTQMLILLLTPLQVHRRTNDANHSNFFFLTEKEICILNILC